MFHLLVFFCWTITSVRSLISPTNSNDTHEYYITSLSGSFSDNEIVCTSPSCFIKCDIQENCEHTIINASLSTTLFLECSQYRSCFYADIIEGPSDMIYINCLWKQACRLTDFNIANTANVDVTCFNANCGGNCGSTEGSCYQTIFNANYSSNINVFAGDRYETNVAKFHVNHVQTATFTGGSGYSLWGVTIYAREVTTQLTVNCNGTRSCRYAKIYCPAAAPCNISCNYDSVGNECQETDVFIATNISSDLYMDCGIVQSQCDQVDIFCLDTDSSSRLIFAENVPGFICLDNKCCPDPFNIPGTIISCNVSSECIIDCSDFGGCPVHTTINATYASSLTLNCNNNYECQWLNIKCPNNGECVLNCLQDYSCEYMHVLQETVSSFDLLCEDNRACLHMDIYLTVTGNVNIICFAAWSSDWMFMDIMFYGNFDVQCRRKGACRWNKWFLEGVDTSIVTIIADGGATAALYRSNLYINNANTFNMTCGSANYIQSCQDMDMVSVTNVNEINIICINFKSCHLSVWDLQASNIMFLCDGDRSCKDNSVTANVSNSISMVTTNTTAFMDIIFNVYCHECLNTFNCMENLTVYCGSDVNPYSTGVNDQCRNCMCDQSINTEQSILYNASNGVWNQCIPTASPTMDPTIDPTHDPREDPTYDPTVDPTIIPTAIPTIDPTKDPTINPTIDPSTDPTVDPTVNPTIIPSTDPTFDPTMDPSMIPTVIPTSEPTTDPTYIPTKDGEVDEATTTQSISTIGATAVMEDKQNTTFLLLDTTMMYIISGIIAVVLILICCIVFIICYKKKANQKQNKGIKMKDTAQIQPISQATTQSKGNVTRFEKINSISQPAAFIQTNNFNNNLAYSIPNNLTASLANSNPIQQMIQQEIDTPIGYGPNEDIQIVEMMNVTYTPNGMNDNAGTDNTGNDSSENIGTGSVENTNSDQHDIITKGNDIDIDDTDDTDNTDPDNTDDIEDTETDEGDTDDEYANIKSDEFIVDDNIETDKGIDVNNIKYLEQKENDLNKKDNFIDLDDLDNLHEYDVVWNGYIYKYGHEPSNCKQLQVFSQKNKKCKSLGFKSAKIAYNERKGKGLITNTKQ